MRVFTVVTTAGAGDKVMFAWNKFLRRRIALLGLICFIPWLSAVATAQETDEEVLAQAQAALAQAQEALARVQESAAASAAPAAAVAPAAATVQDAPSTDSLFEYYADEFNDRSYASPSGVVTDGLAPMAMRSFSGQDVSSQKAAQAANGVYVEYNGKPLRLKGYSFQPRQEMVRREDVLRLQQSLQQEMEFFSQKAVQVPGKRPQLADFDREELNALRYRRELQFPNVPATELKRIATASDLADDSIEMVPVILNLPTRNAPTNQRNQSAKALAAQHVGLATGRAANAATDGDPSTGVTDNDREIKLTPFLLGVAPDANDVLYSPFFQTNQTRMGAAATLRGTAAAGIVGELENVSAALRVSPSFGVFYDTRTTDPNFNIAALQTSRQASDGQAAFADVDFESFAVPTTILFDTEAFNKALPFLGQSNQLQFFVEASNQVDNSELEFRNLYGRIWNTQELTVAAGKIQSLFSINGVAPASLAQATQLIGASNLFDQNRGQLRVQRHRLRHDGKITYGVAIEDFLNDDFDLGGQQVLNRWPTMSAAVHFQGLDQANNLMLSSVFRNYGLQVLATGEEQFDLAWGLNMTFSRTVRQCHNLKGVLFGSIAGGDGVGSYISGVSRGAIFSAGNLDLIQSLGAYVGYRQQWVNRRGWFLDGNLAFGHSSMDLPGGSAGDLNEELNQAWANLFVHTTDQVAVGVEWQWGRRETFGIGNGDNSRIFFGVQFTTKPPGATTEALQNDKGQVASNVERATGSIMAASVRDQYTPYEQRTSQAYRIGL